MHAGGLLTTLVFLHVLGAILWIGSMITLRVAFQPALGALPDESQRLQRSLSLLKKYFLVSWHAVPIMIITGLWMFFHYHKAIASLTPFVHTKLLVWALMTAVFVVGFMAYKKAQKFAAANDVAQAWTLVQKVATKNVTLNIILGLVALYLGVRLRGF